MPEIRLIWAIDAFQKLDRIQRNTLHAIRTICSGPTNAPTSDRTAVPTVIEPVYVIPPEFLTGPEFYLFEQMDIVSRATEALKRKLEGIDLPGLTAPTVLNRPAFTIAGAAATLSEHARKQNAELIVCGTHGRHGLSRLFLGSFAESLILQSPVPILTIGRSTRHFDAIEHILFPTDFENESQAVFPRVLRVAKRFGAKISMLHIIYKPIVLVPGPKTSPLLASYLRDRKQKAENAAERFLRLARDAQVQAKLELPATDETVTDAIARFSKKHDVSLIAMAARSGRVKSSLTGSVTRQVIRSASHPVWVLRGRLAATEQVAA